MGSEMCIRDRCLVFTDVKQICNIRRVFDQYISILKSLQKAKFVSHNAGNALEVKAPPSLRLYPRPPIDQTMHQPLETYTMLDPWSISLGAPSSLRSWICHCLLIVHFHSKPGDWFSQTLVRYQRFFQHFFSLLNLRYSVLYVCFSKNKMAVFCSTY